MSQNKFKDFFLTYLIILMVLFIVFSIIIFPSQSVKAAYDGLIIWFTVVLPALLPFFIGSEVLIGLGVVNFIGVLLEPIMRPLFNVPGEGSFAFAMSLTSGYPVGVKITSKLRSDKIISKTEGQRLLSFCSTSGPLFLIGAVSVGMFQSNKIGILLATSHYLGAILVGILFRFYKKSPRIHYTIHKSNTSVIKRAFCQLYESRKNNPPFGILLGRAVKDAFNTMIIVGGFIVLFSVIINILKITGTLQSLSYLFYYILYPLQINFNIIEAIITGFFEITIGCKIIANISNIDLLSKVAAASFVIAWSGFSIHAQCISIISTTDINPSIYVFSKLLHGIFSFCLVYGIYPILFFFTPFSLPAFNNNYELSILQKLFYNFKMSVHLFILIIICLLIVSLVISFFLNLNCGKKRR